MHEQALSDIRAVLAPAGTLRVGLNYSNFLLVKQHTPTHEGVAPDVARELGRRLGVEIAFVGYANAGLVADAAKTAEWDIAFIGAEPARAGEIMFTPAYVEIEATYALPEGSVLAGLDAVDQPGVRIASTARAAYTLYLERTLKHATLVLADGLDGTFELFVRERLDVLAGLKPRLLRDVQRIPGARLMDGHFTTIQQAMGIPRDRAEAAPYLVAFGKDIQASGFVADLIARHGAHGLRVASPA